MMFGRRWPAWIAFAFLTLGFLRFLFGNGVLG